MKKTTTLFAAVFVLIASITLSADTTPKEGKTNIINSEYSFIYQFNEKPKMGTCILKVNLLKNNEKVKDLAILVSYSMPTCGVHRNPGKPVPMQLNNKNDYLTPVNFVMRGTWEVVLTFQQKGKNLYSATLLVDI
ncbi:MAG: FixH family protein [Leptospirales bacterium]|nr:FixH family protein [Leptospirales bacterium]